MGRLALLSLLSAILLYGCLVTGPTATPTPGASGNITNTPLPTLAVTLQPLPTVISTPTPSPTPTPPPLVESVRSCPLAQEGKCLTPLPRYCKNGRIQDNCIECGCPANSRCARSGPFYGFACLANNVEGENFTLPSATAIATPTSNCITNNTACTMNSTCCNATYTCTYNATLVNFFCQSPVPTPYPPAKPPATYAMDEMLNQIDSAYKSLFNESIAWGVQEVNRSYVYTKPGAIVDVDLRVTKGIFSGFGSSGTIQQVEGLTNHWITNVSIDQGLVNDPDYHYDSVFGCFNWTYRIASKITEHSLGNPAYLGLNFTKKIVDVCPP